MLSFTGWHIKMEHTCVTQIAQLDTFGMIVANHFQNCPIAPST